MRKSIYAVLVIFIFITVPTYSRDLNKELYEAAKRKDIRQIEDLIKSGADVKGEVLHITAYSRLTYKNILLFYLRETRSFNEKDLEILKIFIKSGAPINLEANNNYSPLMLVCNKLILNHTIIMELVKFMIDHGANVNYRAKKVIVQGHETALGTLLSVLQAVKDREDIHSEGVKVLKYLIKKKADVNLQENLLRDAVFSKAKLEVIEILVKAGADINARVNKQGDTLLHLFGRKYKTDETDYEYLRVLIKKGAYLEKKNKRSLTPLMTYLLLGKDLELSRILIRAGADVKARDKYGNTALLLLAKYFPERERMSLLIDSGADSNAHNIFGETPLSMMRKKDPNNLNLKNVRCRLSNNSTYSTHLYFHFQKEYRWVGTTNQCSQLDKMIKEAEKFLLSKGAKTGKLSPCSFDNFISSYRARDFAKLAEYIHSQVEYQYYYYYNPDKPAKKTVSTLSREKTLQKLRYFSGRKYYIWMEENISHFHPEPRLSVTKYPYHGGTGPNDTVYFKFMLKNGRLYLKEMEQYNSLSLPRFHGN